MEKNEVHKIRCFQAQAFETEMIGEDFFVFGMLWDSLGGWVLYRSRKHCVNPKP